MIHSDEKRTRRTSLHANSYLIERDPALFVSRMKEAGRAELAYEMLVSGSSRKISDFVRGALVEVAAKISDEGNAFVLLWKLAPEQGGSQKVRTTCNTLVDRICETGRYARRSIDESEAQALEPDQVKKLESAAERWSEVTRRSRW